MFAKENLLLFNIWLCKSRRKNYILSWTVLYTGPPPLGFGPHPTGSPPSSPMAWGWRIDFEKPQGWGILTQTPWPLAMGFWWGFTYIFVLFRRQKIRIFAHFLKKLSQFVLLLRKFAFTFCHFILKFFSVNVCKCLTLFY